jgi:hypothetical protein
MSTLKTLGLAIAITFAASSFACAQQNNPATNQQGNPAANQPGNPAANPQGNPAASQQGNPAANTHANNAGGTHQAKQKTGGAANSQKMAHNQNGHEANRHGRRRLYSYFRMGSCRTVHHPVSGRLVTVCHR